MDHINLFSTKYSFLYLCSHQDKTGVFWQPVLRTSARETLCAFRISFCELEESFHRVLMITFPLEADAQENSSLMGELSLTSQTSSCQLQLMTKDLPELGHCA